MAISWKCKQFGIDCDHEITCETVEEMKERWAKHAHEHHPLAEMPTYLHDRLRAVMAEEN